MPNGKHNFPQRNITCSERKELNALFQVNLTTTIKKAPTPAPAAALRFLKANTNLTAAPAGQVLIAPLKEMLPIQKKVIWATSAPRNIALFAVGIWAMFLTTDQKKPQERDIALMALP